MKKGGGEIPRPQNNIKPDKVGLNGWGWGVYPISTIRVLNEFSVKPNNVGLLNDGRGGITLPKIVMLEKFSYCKPVLLGLKGGTQVSRSKY